MGKGIDAARSVPGAEAHAGLMDDFKDQLLIVFLKRLKEKYSDDLVFPITETDNTSQDMLAFKIEGQDFIFVLEKKS